MRTANEADEQRGTARGRARYVCSQTGRPVVNDVRATFRFVGGGLISEQRGAHSSSA